MHRFAEPVGPERPPRKSRWHAPAKTDDTVVDGERHIWKSFALKIAAGEAGSEDAFAARYAAGVRVLLRRNLGSIRLESLLRETLSGAAEEIRRGTLTEPTHFIQFVRAVIARHLEENRAAANNAPLTAPVLNAADRMRLRETEHAVRQALVEFTPLEREILTSYYSRGFTKPEIQHRYGVDAGTVDKLRVRMQDLVRPVRERTAPTVERRLPLVRRASAGGD